MKFFKANIWVLILFGTALFSSCDSDDDPQPDQQTQSSPTPEVPGDADAVLAAIEIIAALPAGTPQVPGVSGLSFDVASANFFSSGIGSSRVNVGIVGLNGNDLQNISGNSYISNPQTVDNGINVGQSNTWEIAGNNGFDAFSHTTSKVMPQQVRFAGSVGDTFSTGGEITLSVQSVPSNADNILWLISDGNRVITKESKTTSVTFSASEVGTLSSTSNGLVQAAAFNIESQTYGGKKIYFINETVDSKLVTLN
ncbi:hypothetical protein [Algoriphagus sediminis]|uniref:Uncharacterized protein n=1 Tax=Algoriphagus sediminis TaxID=3057113 RepID=A0ABT7Y8W9_9BACT|nr:hypothetical protein [Algoriphagus sediminis]MDN3202970.1 hypothetical protein [Algoriphagus sediminis]